MIRIHSQKQLTIEGFESPFERVMDKKNRWVKLGACIPWDDLAFRTVKETLKAFFADRQSGEFVMHQIDIHH